MWELVESGAEAEVEAAVRSPSAEADLKSS